MRPMRKASADLVYPRVCDAAALEHVANVTPAQMAWAKVRTGGFVSLSRRQATVQIALAVLSMRVPGDFVETGTYTGGTSTLMAWALQSEPRERWRALWAADSFRGIPAATAGDVSLTGADYERVVSNADDPGRNVSWRPASALTGKRVPFHRLATSRMTFEANLRHHAPAFVEAGLLHILAGWFNDTLHVAPIERISFLRLDGDAYESTLQALTALYHKLAVGGIVYVDDYGSFVGCRRAVTEFRAAERIQDPLVPIAERGTGGAHRFEAVWWQKSSRHDMRRCAVAEA